MNRTATRRDKTGAYVIGMGKQKNSVKPSEVMYIAGERNYSRFVRRKQPSVLASVSLANYERLIPEFVRIHKHFLANPAFVEQLVPDGTNRAVAEIILIDGKRLPVSRRRRKSTFEQLFP